MKLADQILARLDEGFSLHKRLRLIKKEIESSDTRISELLNHLSSLEQLLEKESKSKDVVKLLIRKVEQRLLKAE